MRLGAIDVRLAFKWDFHLVRQVFVPESERTNCGVIAELAIGNVRFRQKCVRICFTFIFERRFGKALKTSFLLMGQILSQGNILSFDLGEIEADCKKFLWG